MHREHGAAHLAGCHNKYPTNREGVATAASEAVYRPSLVLEHDHAQYIQSWLRVLKADKRAVFTAASKAQQACDWLVKRAESNRATGLAA